jgi:hypothetical protein
VFCGIGSIGNLEGRGLRRRFLGSGDGRVIGALLTTSLQTPASVLDFATLQSAVSTGMMVGFVTGVGS